MSASSFEGLAHPKGRPKALAKADRAKARLVQHWDENHKVRLRSKGRCEARVAATPATGGSCISWPCHRYATEIHHLIGGSGRRNVGRSILAEHKLHVCRKCHDEITRHILEPSSDRAADCVFTRRT